MSLHGIRIIACMPYQIVDEQFNVFYRTDYSFTAPVGTVQNGAFDLQIDSVLNSQIDRLIVQGIIDHANMETLNAEQFVIADVVGGLLGVPPHNRGQVTLDFGDGTGWESEISAVITGQTYIDNGRLPRAWMVPASTADNDSDSHIMASDLISLACGDIVPGVGFTIFAFSDGEMVGTFKANWAWN